MTDTSKQEALDRLKALAEQIEAEDEAQASRRAERNRLIFETASRRDTTITEVAAAAKVTHSYATRALRGKGEPGSGSRAQAAAERKRLRAAAKAGNRKGRAAA